jgi:hypothetical protein
MAKGRGKNSSASKTTLAPRRSGLVLWSVILVALVAGLATWYFIPRRSPLSDAATYHGGPRLAVDNELIDFGDRHFNRFVEARFLLRNVGDQPLKLAADSPVEAIEGC